MTGGKEGGREIKPESHDLESPWVRVAAWGTASPLTDGPTGQSWPRAGSHGRWKRLLWQSGTDFHGDREILVGGGGFPVAVPWLPEPEPCVDGRAGGGGGTRGPLSQFRRPARRRGPRPQRAAAPPPEGTRPGAVRVLPMEIQTASVGRARWPPCGDSPSSSPVWPRGRSLRAAPGPPSGFQKLATTEISTRHSGRVPSATATPQERREPPALRVFKSQERSRTRATGRGGCDRGPGGKGGAGMDGGVPGRNPDGGGRRGGEARPGQRHLQDLKTDSTTESKSTECRLVTVRRTRGLLPRARPLGGGGAYGVTEPAFHPPKCLPRRQRVNACSSLWKSQS